jgi:hypothetical protein
MLNIVTGLLNDTSQCEDFDFSAFLNMDRFDESVNSHPNRFEPPTVINPVTEEAEASDVQPIPGPSTADLGNNSSQSGNTSPFSDPTYWIKGTLIFLQVMRFMTCKDPKSLR